MTHPPLSSLAGVYGQVQRVRGAGERLIGFFREQPEDSYYKVRGASLLLPVELSYPTAERLCRAFEAAARAHQQAEARRKDFKVVE